MVFVSDEIYTVAQNLVATFLASSANACINMGYPLKIINASVRELGGTMIIKSPCSHRLRFHTPPFSRYNFVLP
ncbi:hypothetical protein HGRIS_012635 [Hohenbuehelia grisea]|uniref:Uncharacterized protein n=1 Tax=Hohenbuehelia grisea TaxID=104357 RepID=A0ABR3IT53_9AGAR